MQRITVWSVLLLIALPFLPAGTLYLQGDEFGAGFWVGVGLTVALGAASLWVHQSNRGIDDHE